MELWHTQEEENTFMHELYIGLMSGTSVDGIDAALVDFSQAQPKLVGHHYAPWHPTLRAQILALCQPGADEINRLGELEVALGKQFALAANTLLAQNNLTAKQICAIGSHGQTIRHHPQHGFSLQIGDPNIIAAATNITTVADFRRRDIALGGQGAPLVPAFHQVIFKPTTCARVILNIGGIANITLLPLNSMQPSLGFDTGPGNTLFDAWAEKHLQQPCDAHGAWGRQGQIQENLLQRMLDDVFFLLPAPKSTGREYFNLSWLEKFSVTDIQPVDVQATLVELTAQTIVRAIAAHFAQAEILICGGGVHNLFLLERLKSCGKNYTFASTEKFGVHPDWVEAMAFAWLAKQTLEHKVGNLPAVTGAKQASVLGGVYYAR